MGLDAIKATSFNAVRKQTFINVTAKDTKVAGTYDLMNIRGDANTWETGVETEDIADVTQKIQPTEVSSVAPSLSVSQLALEDDPVYQMFESIFDNSLTGAEVHHSILRVKFADDDFATLESVKHADAVVQVTSFPNEAGSNSRVEATVQVASDWKDVDISKCTYSDGVITVTA